MKILVIEDDVTTNDFISQALQQDGYVVDNTFDGREGLMMATSADYQLIVLDRLLPGLDGLKLLAALRAAQINTPVLLLSALNSVMEKVEGLDAGADDYLTKPFALAELLARVRLLLRRQTPVLASPQRRIGQLVLNLQSHTVQYHGQPITLAHKEFVLLQFLMQHAGEVVSRMRLFEAVWNYHFDPKTNVIDVHIARLRKKLEQGGHPCPIETVRGAGYVIRN